MGNRRKFKRVTFKENFEVNTDTWSDPSAKGLDISLNGCRFHCEQLLSEDETVSLSFKPGFELRGNIRWCWPIEWYYLSAIHFENISVQEQEKLKSYIEEVTGENYQMEKEEESSNEIIEDLDGDKDDIDYDDIDDDDIDDDEGEIGFDVVGKDQNEEEDITDNEIGDVFEDFPQLNEEDLDTSVNEPTLVNTDSFSNEIEHENISHKFGDYELSPLSFKGKHIVIFDFEKEQAEILNRYLNERLGMEVDIVSKKHNLWRHLKIDPLELIIIETGSKSNYDALETMQQTKDQFPEVDFICISGPVSLERRMHFFNAGSLDYLTRPIHLSSIAQSILLNLSRMDYYKKDHENEEFEPSNYNTPTLKHSLDSNETFHDEDISGTLDLLDEDLDVSREIELVDEDF